MIKVKIYEVNDFDNLFRMYYSDLCTYAVRYVHSNNLAEDLVSETFYSLWKIRETLGEINNIKAYLFKSVHNNCLFYIRSQKNKVRISDVDFSIIEESSPLERDVMHSLILKELTDQLDILIEKLPPQQQIVFRMKRFENKKSKEIAEELNLSVKTVEMHMTKATSFLKSKLKNIFPFFIIVLLLDL